MLLYHGTSTKHLRRIMREGLQPRQKHGFKGNWEGTVESKPDLVYLTSAYPVWFAWSAIGPRSEKKHKPDDLVVIQCRIDEDEIYPDEDWLASIVHAQGQFPELELHEINPLVNPLINKELGLKCVFDCGKCAVTHVDTSRFIGHRIIEANDFEAILALGGDASPTSLAYRALGGMYREAMEIFMKDGRDAAIEHTRRWWDFDRSRKEVVA